MNKNWKALLICLAIPLTVGGLAALLSGGGMIGYRELNQPPLSPPGWVFPVVWTILYLLMGYASFRVLYSQAPKEQIRKALGVYAGQLLLNFLWPILFFGFGWYLAAFFLLLLLWVGLLLTIRLFAKADEQAALLLTPYLLWVTFAGYLNLGVYFLN